MHRLPTAVHFALQTYNHYYLQKGTMSHMKRWKRPLQYTLLYLSLPLFIILTNPRELPLLMLWVPFLLLFAILFVTTRKLMSRRLAGKKLITVSVTVAIIPVLLVILASIGQLTARDILISFALVLGTIWYLNRLDV